MLMMMSRSTYSVRAPLICVARTARWELSMLAISISLMPKMAPTANTPAAMLSTARSVRVLLCQRSNQILYQMTLILVSSHGEIALLVLICDVAEPVARGLGLAQ